MKVRVPISGTIGKSVAFDPNAGARAEAAVAALAAQINAGLGGSIRHSSLQGLQIGDDHPQYTGNQFPETVTGQWNFQTIPFIQGNTLAEYIEDVVGGSFFDFLQDTTSVVWTFFDTANELEANVPPEFVQDTVGAMLVDTATVDFTYDDALGQISAVVPGAALTKTDDTNVTLAFGGTPLTALARAASLTLGWTGQLAVPRGGSGAATLTGYLKGNGTAAFTASATIPGSDITGAALSKTDDTNVTLTLGGSPTTALLNASSLTLGWTGQLAVPRGGSGAATLTGYLKGNGTAAFTASSTIPYSDISGTPTIPTGANPSALVGLVAVNGSATSFFRSDGAPALSQAISPTWTGNHTFTPASGNTVVHAGNLRLDVDSLEVQLGASQDLRLYHDGTNNVIRSDGGAHLLLNFAGGTIGSMASRFFSLGNTAPASGYSGSSTMLNVKGIGSSEIGSVKVESAGTTNLTKFEMFAADSAAEAGIFVETLSDMAFYTNGVERARILAAGTALKMSIPVRLKGYTVATLPAGTANDTAFVSDALAPVFGAAVAGGGAVTVPVYYTGAAWFVG